MPVLSSRLSPRRFVLALLAAVLLSGCYAGATLGSDVQSTVGMRPYVDAVTEAGGNASVPTVNVGSAATMGVSFSTGGEPDGTFFAGYLHAQNDMEARAVGADGSVTDRLAIRTLDRGTSVLITHGWLVGAVEAFSRRATAERSGVYGSASGTASALVARPVVGLAIPGGSHFAQIIGIVGVELPLLNPDLIASEAPAPVSGLGADPIRVTSPASPRVSGSPSTWKRSRT